MNNQIDFVPRQGAVQALGVFSWLGIALGLLLAALLYFNPTYTFRVTETQLQEQVDERLPLEANMLGLHLRVEPGATMELLGEDRVRVTLTNFSAYPPLAKTTHYAGRLVVSGKPDYEGKAFYLREVQIEEQEGDWTVSDRAQVALNIGKNLLEKLAKRPGEDNSALERLMDPENLKAAATKFVNDVVFSHAIYRLKGQSWWQSLLGASLESVEVTDTDIAATLGVRGLMTVVLLMVAVGVFAAALLGGMMTGQVGAGTILTLGLFSALSG